MLHGGSGRKNRTCVQISSCWRARTDSRSPSGASCFITSQITCSLCRWILILTPDRRWADYFCWWSVGHDRGAHAAVMFAHNTMCVWAALLHNQGLIWCSVIMQMRRVHGDDVTQILEKNTDELNRRQQILDISTCCVTENISAT